MTRPPGTDVGRLLVLSAVATAAGTLSAFWIEQQVLSPPASLPSLLVVGLLEEALARLVPLVCTFYLWSYCRRRLLSKTEGLLATVVSGLTVSGLELVFKLRYLARLEQTARLDALLLPIAFVHLPLALVAGRFAYALGERVHGSREIGMPRPSRRTLGYFVGGYLLLVAVHVTYNAVV